MADRPLLIKGGRIIDPSQGLNVIGSLLVKNGKIAVLDHADEAEMPADCDVIHAGGMVVAPGFIDLHCHLRQPGFEDKETIETGTQAAAAGGFTTICCMPNTSPPLDNVETLDLVKNEAEEKSPVRVLPIACVTENRAGESLAPLAELAAAGAVGFSDDGDSVMDTALMLQALRQAKELGLIVIEHCEHKVLARNGVMNQGKVSAQLGLPGMPAVAEDIIASRDVALCRLTGGHLHIAHVSTAATVDVIREAKKVGLPVTAEVTPHHLTLTEDIVATKGADAKVNPPLRTEEDVRVLVEALREGVIDAIATDHAPHTAAEKAAGMLDAPSGINGFETALGSLMKLVHSGEIELDELIFKMTAGPASILGNKFGQLGTLSVGAPADIVIIDTEKKWKVDTGKFISRGKNTPLQGEAMQGRVMATVAGGRVAYCDASLKITGKKE